MKGTLLGFLIILASFPDILAEFQAEAERVAKEYGLSDEQLAAIKSNDYKEVEKALRAENRGILWDIHDPPQFGSHFHAVKVSAVTAFLTPLDSKDGDC